LQVQFGGLAKLLLLCHRDALQAAAKIIVLTVSHFDENQHLPVQHDDIDFTMATVKIFIDDFQAFRPEIFAAGCFCIFSLF
jgi:hypothetical protein